MSETRDPLSEIYRQLREDEYNLANLNSRAAELAKNLREIANFLDPEIDTSRIEKVMEKDRSLWTEKKRGCFEISG